MAPCARENRLGGRGLPDEVLVYDLDRHKVHCLNRTAALVWRQCDGRTTVAELARLLEKELGGQVDEAVVWVALESLGRAHLLRGRVRPPAGVAGLSRREVMRRLALGGGLSVLLPAVTSIVAPTAAEAQSACTKTRCESGTTPTCNGCIGKPCCPQECGKTCGWFGE